LAGFRILPVTDRQTRRAFLDAPAAVLAGDPNFIQPLRMEAAKQLQPKKHPFYGHGEAAFWVALDEAGRPAGRISAQVNRAHQARYGAGEGHFGCLAARDEAALFEALTGAAEDWLRQKGATVALGPASLSVNEEFGLLVEGFDAPPMMLMGHDAPWTGSRLEALGYEKAEDLIAYRYDPSAGPPRRLKAFADKLSDIEGARVRTFDKRNFDRDLGHILDIFNDAWSENWGYVPMSEAEIKEMAHALKQLADYEMIFIVEIRDRPVGMAVCFPNLNEALQGLGGAASPLGLLKMLWRLKVRGVKSARVLLMGVLKDVQADMGVGPVVGIALVSALVEAAAAKGYSTLELSWILESNRPMRRIAEFGEAEPYKTYRVYRKALI